MINIIIQGQGVVGQSTELFINKYTKDVEIIFNDPFKEVAVPADAWSVADYVIICVNTDLDESLTVPENSTANIDAAMNQALENGFMGRFILRSTTSVECVKLLLDQIGPRLIVWPEFIREATWQEDSINPRMVLLGGDNVEDFALLFDEAFNGPVIVTDPLEAMVAKLSTNAFLAMKVIFANQVFALCNNYGADYNIVKQLLENEGRLGSSHWAVPGPDGELGFAGKCFPKDIRTFEADLIKTGIHVDLIRAVININDGLRQK
jgi:nucleotide sugar dehydrogenase